MMKYLYKTILFLLLIPLFAFTNPHSKKHEKSKTIKKTFAVNSNALVALNNKYGNLNITTWNKNSVEIEIIITVKGDDLEDVENKLETITVNFDANKSKVEATTKFTQNKSSWSWWKGNKNINYKVNYIVKMPETNAVDLDNDYGNIYLDKLAGKADINCGYGKIEVGELKANNNTINLDYCSRSTISYLKNGNIHVDYSKITIEDSEKLRLNADYSKVKVNKTFDIHFNTDYGSITIDTAENVSGNSDYTSMGFGTIKKNLEIDTEYGSLRVKELSKSFENVKITSEYAGIKIGIEEGANFDFEIDLQYAGFNRNAKSLDIFKSISKSSKKYYEGIYGKGSKNSRIKIYSQYGSVTFTDNH